MGHPLWETLCWVFHMWELMYPMGRHHFHLAEVETESQKATGNFLRLHSWGLDANTDFAVSWTSAFMPYYSSPILILPHPVPDQNFLVAVLRP